jgi:DNA polymerase-3 subunit gamma/tau
MVIIRLSYAADLPDPADLIKKLKDQPVLQSGPAIMPSAPRSDYAPVARSSSGASAASQILPAQETQSFTEQAIHKLEDVISVLQNANEFLLASQVFQFVHLVKIEEGRLEFRPGEHAPPKLAQELGPQLTKLTGRRWMVSVSGLPGAPTLAEKLQNERAAEFAEVLAHPSVTQIMAIFPGAQLTAITDTDDNQG